MKQTGDRKHNDPVSPSLQRAATRMLAAALTSAGVTVEEPSATKSGVKLTWPNGSSLHMAFVFDSPTSRSADDRKTSEIEDREAIHVLRSASPRRREELRLRGLNFVDVGTGAVRITARG